MKYVPDPILLERIRNDFDELSKLEAQQETTLSLLRRHNDEEPNLSDRLAGSDALNHSYRQEKRLQLISRITRNLATACNAQQIKVISNQNELNDKIDGVKKDVKSIADIKVAVETAGKMGKFIKGAFHLIYPAAVSAGAIIFALKGVAQ